MKEPAEQVKPVGQSTRWWEFYVVRYTMGSVIGACILFLLAKDHKLPEQLEQLIEFGTSKSDTANVLWLILLGITYCYITSGPILVFHAGRFLLKEHTSSLWKLFAFSAAPPVFLLVVFCGKSGWFLASAYFFAFIVLAQIGVTFLCLAKKPDLNNFYSGLSKARAAGHEHPDKAEMIESYRHLKEHGNSFFIVLCEIIFAAGIYFAPEALGQTRADHSLLSLMLCLWIVPPVFVWLIATLLEREYRDTTKETP